MCIRDRETGCGLFICNLGTGKGYSVLDVIHAFSKACGKEIPYVIDPRRPGDIAECLSLIHISGLDISQLGLPTAITDILNSANAYGRYKINVMMSKSLSLIHICFGSGAHP